jgi:[acyl-carrier-protein] S-malonyltransferase
MGKIAFLFPGQGSQSVGMGLALSEAYPYAAELFKQADSILDRPLSQLMFHGPESDLLPTVNTQPALYVTSAVAYQALLSETELRPDAAAGHSIGEYAALYAAGVFDFKAGLELVSRRSDAMQKCASVAGGAMAAVLGLPAHGVRELCKEVEAGGSGIVDPANFNSPGQVVISGESVAVAAASALAKDRGAKKVMPLNVSGAFHSRLMAPAAQEMTEVLSTAKLSAPSFSVLANVTADYVTDPEEIRRNLSSQIDHPVRWEEILVKLASDGYDRFLEVGSGSVLAGLVKRTLTDVKYASFGGPADLEKVLNLGVSQ